MKARTIKAGSHNLHYHINDLNYKKSFLNTRIQNDNAGIIIIPCIMLNIILHS